MKQLKFRFRLATLFILVGLSAVGFLGYRRWLDRQPIQWINYSTQVFSKHPNDVPAMIFVGADWDANSMVVREMTLKDLSVKRTLRRYGVATYYADGGYISPDVKALMKQHGLTSTPAVLVFPEGPAGPVVVLKAIPTVKQIIDSIESLHQSAAIEQPSHRQ